MRALQVLACGFLVLALAALSGCQTPTTDVRDQHLAGWESQLASYAAQVKSQQERFKRRADEHMKVDLKAQPDPWATLISQVFESAQLIREAETMQGRYDVLRVFINQMRSAPEPGVMEAWFIRYADDIQTAAKSLEASTADYLRTFDDRVRRGPNEWISPALLLATNRGRAEGMAQELQSLYRQAVAYYQDLSRSQAEERRQAQERARAGAAIAALGASIFLMNSYQQQMINAINRPRTCSFTGNVITCY